MTETLKCYRVWMKDGYAGLYDAPNQEDAKAQAAKAARDGLESCNSNPDAKENRAAITVDYVDCLDD